MIIHVTGRLGSGKTLWGVQKIIEAITSGVDVYTNIRLVNYWDYELAQYQFRGFGSFLAFLISPFFRKLDYCRYLACRYSQKYHYISDFPKMLDVLNSAGSSPEGSRLVVWDEVHLDVHARAWKSSGMDILSFFSMSRKLGFDVILISQLRSAVDRQVRELADFSYELKKLRFLNPFGWRVFPNIGLLVKRWANVGLDSGKSVWVGAGIVRYNSWYIRIYDTRQLLTVRDAPSPVLWWSQDVGHGYCFGCSYFSFYNRYYHFVRDFASSNNNYCRLGKRKLIIFE